jgi:hypothetical protein
MFDKHWEHLPTSYAIILSLSLSLSISLAKNLLQNPIFIQTTDSTQQCQKGTTK